MQKVTQGSVGIALRARVIDHEAKPVNLTGATTLSILARPPRGVVKTFTAALVGDAANGVVEYVTTEAEDLDSFGFWTYAPRAVWETGDPVVIDTDLRGLPIQFEVVEYGGA